MRLSRLVFAGLGRNKVRTVLTTASVVVALFLFCALRGVLDTLDASIKVGSEARLVTRNKISLIFPLPPAYRDRIASVAGVKRVSYGNWFGGRDPADERNFYAQFAVDGPTYFPVYAKDVEIVAADKAQSSAAVPEDCDPKLAAFFEDQRGAVVGQHLFQRMNWKMGQTVQVAGTIFPGNWPFNIRAVYHAKDPAFGEDALLFHWKYLEQQGMRGQGLVGWYILELSDPNRAGEVTHAVDALYENSPAATHTETERAFQAGFVSMYGNVPFLIGLLGMVVVVSMLMVAANTMMMATRERTGEFAILKTLGFEDRTIFGLVLVEAGAISVIGGFLGAMLAKWALEGTGFNAGGFLPPMSVRWSTVFLGVGIAVAMGAVSGLVPALQASRLRIVDAIRRVE